jgi:DNA polymerase bacteriophage-type
MTHKVYLDFETRSCADLKSVGAALYAEHPTTDILCVGIQHPIFGETAVSLQPEEFYEEGRNAYLNNWAANPAIIFTAHNSIFEQHIWHNIMHKRYGYPDISVERWRCTMAKSYASGLPGSLKEVAKVLNLSMQKDMDGRDNMLSLSKPKGEKKITYTNAKKLAKKYGLDLSNVKPKNWHEHQNRQDIADLFAKTDFWSPEEVPDKFQKLYTYCLTDVEVCKLVDEALSDLNPKEQQVWQLDQTMNKTGLLIDRPLVTKVTKLINNYNSDLLTEFETLTGLESPRQREKFLEYLNNNGIVIDNTQKSTLAIIETEDPKVKRALEIARELGKSSTAKYYTMLDMSTPEGSLIPGLVREIDQYHAAHTGRYGGRGIQFQNLPRTKPLIPLDEIQNKSYSELIQLYPDLMVRLSSIIRSMVVPKMGYKFIIGDFRQMEARVLAWLAGQWDVIEAYARGEDPYCNEATKIFGYTVTPDMLMERQVGKTAVLALGYAGGIGSFANIAKQQGVTLLSVADKIWEAAEPEEQGFAMVSYERYQQMAIDPLPEAEALCADIIKQRWRKNNSSIAKFWKRLEASTKEAIKDGFSRDGKWTYNNKCLRYWLPSGRTMTYPFARLDYHNKLSYYSANARETGFREETHGGKLAENITQAVQRDLLVEVLLNLVKYDLSPVFHVHDEIIVTSSNIMDDLPKFESIMSAVPDWAPGLPIDIEVKVSDRYEK